MSNRILKFETPGCGPCKAMDKVITTLQLETDIEKINVYEDRETAKQYNVRSVPTLVKIDSDGKELGRMVGFQSANDLMSFAKLVK